MLSDHEPDFVVYWDGESQSWLASGDYIIGLTLIGKTLEELGRRADSLIPELMELNDQTLRPRIID